MLTAAEQAELAALEAKYGGASSGDTLSPEARAYAGAGEVSGAKELLGGLKHSLDKAAYGIKSLLPQSVQDAGDWLDRKLGMGGLNEEKYRQGKAFVKESSALADVGEVGGDVLMGLAPGGAATRGGAVLKQALGRFGGGTRLATEVAGNAAWNAATAPEDRGTAALLGAGGAAAGAGINRAISGPLANAVTPEARRVMDRGVGLTAGEMVSGSRPTVLGKALHAVENATSSIPFLGNVVRHRAAKSVEEWNVTEINKVLQGTDVKVNTPGTAGFDEARSGLRKQFDEVVAHVRVDPDVAKQTFEDLGESLKHLPLLNDQQQKYLEKWVNLHFGKHLNSGEVIDGHTARVLDRGISEEVAKWRKGGAWDQTMADALEQVQGGWREVLQSSVDNPEAAATMQKLVRAQDELKFLQRASDKTASGVFTPLQMQRVYERANRPFTGSLKDAKATLPAKMPDMGGAERTLLYHVLSPGGVSGLATGAGLLAGFTPLVTAAGTLGAAYTKPGTKYLASGLLPKKLTDKLSREEVEHVIKLLSQQGARAGLNKYNAQE
jgi:hypothetical protein